MKGYPFYMFTFSLLVCFKFIRHLIDRLPFLHCVFYAHSFADRILTHCIDRLNFFHSCTGQFISAHCDQCCDPCMF